MAKIGESELKRQLKTGDFSKAYLIYGEESYLKEYYIGRLKEKNVNPDFADFNFHSYTGKTASLSDILSDAEMLPMMGGRNFILVCDYPFEKSAADTDAIKEFLSDIPETTMLVFWYDTASFDSKNSSRLKSVENAFSNAGSVVVLDRRSEDDLVKMVVSGCKKRNAYISPENAKYLISVSGSDIKTLMNEVDKLCAGAGGGEVTKNLINDLAVKCLQARIFDLSKAILRGDYEAAFDVLNTLFAIKEDPVSILSAVSGGYVDMYRVKCAKIAGERFDDVGKYYNYKGREFLLKNALSNSSRLSVGRLRRSLDVLMLADNSLKSTSADKRLILEETLVKLLLITKEAAYDKD